MAFSAMRGAVSRPSRRRPVSSTTPTTRTRWPWGGPRPPREPSPPAVRPWPCSATWPSSGRLRARYYRGVGEHCAAAGVPRRRRPECARDYLGRRARGWLVRQRRRVLAALPRGRLPAAPCSSRPRAWWAGARRRGARGPRAGRGAPCLGPWPPASSPWSSCWSSARPSSAGCALNEFGQKIREDGPAGHKTKEGTPTMGGVLIWFVVIVSFSCSAASRWRASRCSCWPPWATRSSASPTTDKNVRKALAGPDGALQAPAAAAARAVHRLRRRPLRRRRPRRWTCRSPRSSSSSARSGSTPLIFLALAGFSNAVNLTDGLDGLAAGDLDDRAGRARRHRLLIGRNTHDPGITDLMVVAGCIGGAASASSGTTPSRPTCSWATRGRSGSAGRSPPWPS